MPEQSITCPYCKSKFPLDEALSEQIRQQLDQELRLEYNSKLADERQKILEQTSREIQEKNDMELKALKDELEEKSRMLDEARNNELELRKRQREVEDKEKNLELEIARRIDEERKKIVEEVQQKNADQYELKLAEREKTISDLSKQIEELKRKAEQGSQQQQGEVLELKLEEILRSAFPYDIIEPVGKGRKGGDVIQHVHSLSGEDCGAILWEAKRAKAWSDGWVSKLKQDRADAGACIGIIVSTVLPNGYERFCSYDGIWVTDIRSAVGLASALRAGLLEVENTRRASVCKSEKMEMLFQYLQGPQFRQRVEAAVEVYLEMKKELESEKAIMARRWAKRDKMIERAINGVAGMYGDMQGIIGLSIPELEKIEAKALAPATDDGPGEAE
jgi:hypothetical protein